MRGPARWGVAMATLGGAIVGCHGAPWQHVAATPDRCAQRSAIKQEIAMLDARIRTGGFPQTAPVLLPAPSGADRPAGGASTNRATVEIRAEGAAASEGGASPQAISNAELANTEHVMDENAARDRQTVANARVGPAGSTVDPDRVTVKQASEAVPTTRPQAQARIKLLQRQLWDLPSGSSCAGLEKEAGSAR